MPAGALIVGVQKLGGETLQEKRKRERRELHDLKMAEWYAHSNSPVSSCSVIGVFYITQISKKLLNMEGRRWVNSCRWTKDGCSGKINMLMQ